MKIQEIQFPLNIGSADELRIHIGEETESSINVHYVLLDTDQTTEMVGGHQVPYKALYSDKLVVTGNDYVSYKVNSNYINDLVISLLGVVVIPEE